jgi:predicted nucleotidyltransferase
VKKLNREILIGYVYSWISFLFREPNLPKINGIYLFGSVARGEFDEKSDIDVFIDVESKDVEKMKKVCERSLKKFFSSQEVEKFRLRGIENEIKPIVGVLKEWGELKESLEKDSLILFSPSISYGRERQIIVVIEPIKLLAKRNKVFRYLFGRKERVFRKKGIVEAIGGKILTPRSFLIPKESFNEIAQFLTQEKVKFKIIEV